MTDNPKDLIGKNKFPMGLWPTTATALGSLVLNFGALKYGKYNWRHTAVRASIYSDALERHMAAWKDGVDTDTESGLPHLAHALACLAILIDASASDSLIDDRSGKQSNTFSPFEAATAKYANRMDKMNKMYEADLDFNSYPNLEVQSENKKRR